MKKLIACLAFLLVIVSCATAPPLSDGEYAALSRKYPGSDFAMIDDYMLNLDKKDEASLGALSAAIDRAAETDWEKVRAVYVWITHNISYDARGYFGGERLSCQPGDVLENRSSVCSGYARLFTSLSKMVGLDVKDVSGYAKGYSFEVGTAPSGTNHAWNVVTIDGKDHIFDSTWGAGSLWGKRFRFRYKEFYFDADPEEIVFTHFPGDGALQVLDSPLTRDEFFHLPNIHSSMFDHGFDGSEYLGGVREGKTYSSPHIYSCSIPYEIYDFPVTSTLKAGVEYHFLIRSKSSSSLYIKNGEERHSYGSHDGGITR